MTPVFQVERDNPANQSTLDVPDMGTSGRHYVSSSVSNDDNLDAFQLWNRSNFEILTAGTARRLRRAGSMRGLIWMSDDFDAPLPDFDEYMR